MSALLASLALLAHAPAAATAADDASGNPVQRVIGVLERLQAQVKEDGEKEDKLHEKAMCHCKSTGDDLRKAIAESKARVPEVQAGIEEARAAATELQAQIEGHIRDRAAAQKAINDATAVKQNSKEQFGREEALTKTNLAQVERALEALERKRAAENPGTCACRANAESCSQDSRCSWLSDGWSPRAVGDTEDGCTGDLYVEGSTGWVHIPHGEDKLIEVSHTRRRRFKWRCRDSDEQADCGEGNLLLVKSSSRRRFKFECKDSSSYQCDSLQHEWGLNWGADNRCEPPGPLGSEPAEKVVFRVEASDAFCGSHPDDMHSGASPDECRTQCANNPNCKGFTTYENSKCDKCVLYTANDCSEGNRQPTVCDGKVTAYSRELDVSGTGTNTGIAALKQTKETMEEDLRQLAFKKGALEAQSLALYTAKQKDMTIADRLSREKRTRASDLMLKVGSFQRDITDEQASVTRDQQVLDELGQDCQAREDDYHNLRTQISDELEVLGETIKMLSDDDAQALFSKTFSNSAPDLPPVLLQEGADVTHLAADDGFDHEGPQHIHIEGPPQQRLTLNGPANVGQRRVFLEAGSYSRQPLSFIQWVSAPTALSPSPVQSVQSALHVLQQTASASHPETPELSQMAKHAVAAAAEHGHGRGFSKIIELINGMLEIVAKTQEDDDAKKEYCEVEIREEEGQKDMLTQEARSNSAELDSSNDQLATLKTELDDLHKAIAEIDATAQQATANRQQEKLSANQATSQTNAAIQLLGSVQDKLKGFYNRPAAPPGLRAADGEAISLRQENARTPDTQILAASDSTQDAPPAQGQSPQQTLSASGVADTLQSLAVMGEVAQPDVGPGGMLTPLGGSPALDPLHLTSGVQGAAVLTGDGISLTPMDGMTVASELQTPIQLEGAPSVVAPFFGAAPSFLQAASASASDEDLGFLDAPAVAQTRGHGVLEMLARIEADLKREFAALEAAEVHAQAAFNHLMGEYAAKKHDDVQATIEKTGSRADLKEAVQRLKGLNSGLELELSETEGLLQNLHNECDWLITNYEARKQARASEAESMRRVQTVLEMQPR